MRQIKNTLEEAVERKAQARAVADAVVDEIIFTDLRRHLFNRGITIHMIPLTNAVKGVHDCLVDAITNYIEAEGD